MEESWPAVPTMFHFKNTKVNIIYYSPTCIPHLHNDVHIIMLITDTHNIIFTINKKVNRFHLSHHIDEELYSNVA